MVQARLIRRPHHVQVATAAPDAHDPLTAGAARNVPQVVPGPAAAGPRGGRGRLSHFRFQIPHCVVRNVTVSSSMTTCTLA